VRRGVGLAVVGILLGIALAVVPTSYWLISPGSAVDLSKHIVVEGHPPPAIRYYLTDVAIERASPLLLLGGFFPGVRVVHEDVVVPKDVTPRQYDRVLSQAMDDSQVTAAVVAAILPASGARGKIAIGDEIERIDGAAIGVPSDVAVVVQHQKPGTIVHVDVRRVGAASDAEVDVATMDAGGRSRLGLLLDTHVHAPRLPVPVHFSLDSVEGSSGGLMFALQIYGALKADRSRPGTAIAGTGTIAFDGSVGKIEGAQQKLIAAKRVGARIFFVPKENYADVRDERDVRVVPVGSFRDALRALQT